MEDNNNTNSSGEVPGKTTHTDLIMESEQPENAEDDPSLNEQSILSKLEQDVQELKDAVLREKASSENMRKRFEKELAESKVYSVSSFARDLLEIQENLHRALETTSESMNSDQQTKAFVEGVEMTKNLLGKVFEKYFIVRIFPEAGQMFDHKYHQAITQAVDNEKESNTILQVLQAGYIIQDRLLRPALVVVSKKE